MKEKYIFEPVNIPYCGTGMRLGFKIKKKLYSGKSPLQKIEVFNTFGLGRTLFLDGVLQTSEKDEFIYHEMICQIPMLCHSNPQKVLIIGGGDGGALEEVLKHHLEKVWMVEIDKKVTEISRKYLPSISKNAFKDKRAEIIFGDGMKFVKNYKNFFDVIILDLSDPWGPAAKLISINFYRDIKNALKENGVVSVQSGSLNSQPRLVAIIYKRLKKVFPFVRVHRASIPSYGAGEFSLTVASNLNLSKINKRDIEGKIKKMKLNLKYLNPEIFFNSAVLPTYLKEKIKLN